MEEIESKYKQQINELNNELKILHGSKNQESTQLQELLVEVGKKQAICDQENLKFREAQKQLSQIKKEASEVENQLDEQREKDQPNEFGIMKGSQISIVVTEGKNLRTLDTFGKGDPYIALEFEGQKLRTKVAKERYKAEFYQDFKFDVSQGQEAITIKSMDYNQINNDDLTGIGSIDIEQLRDQEAHGMSVPLNDPELKGKDGGTLDMRVK